MVVADPVVVGAPVVVVGTTVVVGPVVSGMPVVVGTVLVGVASVVVGAAVVAAAVVVGLAVVGGAVAVRWVVVVVPEDERAVRVDAPPTLAGAWPVPGRAVVAGLLMAPCSGPGVVDGEVVVVGSRSPVVVVDAAVGAGLVGEVGSATSGERGGWGWGSRVAEATRAARTAVVSPKTNSSSFQGRRDLARCRGGGVGMVHRPASAGSSGS